MPGKITMKASTLAASHNPAIPFTAGVDRQGARLTIPVFETIEERMAWAYKARGLDAEVFELTVVTKEPKSKRCCPVCLQTCNGDDKTLGRHVRTKGHLTNLADYLWVEFDSFLGKDIVVACNKCGEKILGARHDSLYRHQNGPCSKKGEPGASKAPAKPVRKPRARARSLLKAGPSSSSRPRLTGPHRPLPEREDDEDEDERPPRKIARRSIDSEVANGRHQRRSSQGLEVLSPSLPPLTPTTEGTSSAEEDNSGAFVEGPEVAPASPPPPPRTSTPAPLLRPSTRVYYGSTSGDSPAESSAASRRSSVSSGKSSEAEHDVGSAVHRIYSPFNISSSDEEGGLKLLASAATAYGPRMPPSPYNPETYETRWGAEPPISPLAKRAMRAFPPMRCIVTPSYLHAPAVLVATKSPRHTLRPSRTPSPPPSGHYW